MNIGGYNDATGDPNLPPMMHRGVTSWQLVTRQSFD